MFRHTGRTLLACAATVVFLASPGSAEADVLNDWNVIAQSETIPLRPTAHGQMRGMAMVQGAVYDAVNAIDRGYQPYLLTSTPRRAVRLHDAAIATAAHQVLVRSSRRPRWQASTLPTRRRSPASGRAKQGRRSRRR